MVDATDLDGTPYTDDFPIYINVRELAARGPVAWITRYDDVSLTTVEPFCDRLDLLRWMRDHLTPAEYEQHARAFGWPEGVVPLAWLAECGPMSISEDYQLSLPMDFLVETAAAWAAKE